jgi:hypothetical protein
MTFTDREHELLTSLREDDLGSLATVTLPIATQSRQAVVYDAEQRAWSVSSENLNLQVLAEASAEAQPAGHVFGFIVGVLNSVLQVGHFKGRYFCRDGHHRAYQLLRKGVRHVPAVVREFEAHQELAPRPGLFTKEICVGTRPPVLADFLDDAVSADVWHPASRKVVTISVVESVVL